MKMLLVDRDRERRMVFAQKFEAQGFEVRSSDTPDEAVAEFVFSPSETPDIIVCKSGRGIDALHGLNPNAPMVLLHDPGSPPEGDASRAFAIIELGYDDATTAQKLASRLAEFLSVQRRIAIGQDFMAA